MNTLVCTRSVLNFSFRSFCFRPLPFRTIAHTLVRTASPALYRFARSDTPWPQGPRTYSVQKEHNMPWTHGPANITAFLIDFASRFPPGTLVTWILKDTSELISFRDSHRWPIWSVWLLCMVPPINFASRFPPMTRLVRKAPVPGISH